MTSLENPKDLLSDMMSEAQLSFFWKNVLENGFESVESVERVVNSLNDLGLDGDAFLNSLTNMFIGRLKSIIEDDLGPNVNFSIMIEDVDFPNDNQILEARRLKNEDLKIL